jgi:hypothetical protein
MLRARAERCKAHVWACSTVSSMVQRGNLDDAAHACGRDDGDHETNR